MAEPPLAVSPSLQATGVRVDPFWGEVPDSNPGKTGPHTVRLRGSGLATHARTRFKYAKLSPTGRVHIVQGAIIRWDFLGGTYEKPDLTFVTACGGHQWHQLQPVPEECVRSWDVCVRCRRWEERRHRDRSGLP